MIILKYVLFLLKMIGDFVMMKASRRSFFDGAEKRGG